MTENEKKDESISKRYCWGMCGRRSRSRSIFWGLFFIIAGLFWLGKKADWFPPEFITLFWPLVLVAAGIWFIVASLINRGDHH